MAGVKNELLANVAASMRDGAAVHGEPPPGQTPSLVRQHEENVEDLKPDRRHGEEVYGHNRFHMVVKEGPPGLRRWLPTAYQVFAHARFTNLDAEFQQLAVDTRCAPTRILFAHAADQVANLA